GAFNGAPTSALPHAPRDGLVGYAAYSGAELHLSAFPNLSDPARADGDCGIWRRIHKSVRIWTRSRSSTTRKNENHREQCERSCAQHIYAPLYAPWLSLRLGTAEDGAFEQKAQW